MALSGNDTLSVRRTLTAGGKDFDYFSLRAAEEAGVGQISRLPYSMKGLLENLLIRLQILGKILRFSLETVV